jgi:hypothetical protein
MVVNERRESPQIFGGHPFGPLRLAQHLLDEDGVHINQAELEQMQREDRQLLFSRRFVAISPPFPYRMKEFALFQFSITFRASWTSRRSSSIYK